MAEKRASGRQRRRLKVRYGEQQKQIGFVEDLSDNGFFIRTGQVSAPQSLLQIELEIAGEVILLHGRVQWAKRIPANMVHRLKGGMGIQIVAFISGEELYRKVMQNPGKPL